MATEGGSVDWGEIEPPPGGAGGQPLPEIQLEDPLAVDEDTGGVDWGEIEDPGGAAIRGVPIFGTGPGQGEPLPEGATEVDWGAIEGPADLPLLPAPPSEEEQAEIAEGIKALEAVLPGGAYPEGADPFKEEDDNRRLALMLEHLRQARLTAEAGAESYPPSPDTGGDAHSRWTDDELRDFTLPELKHLESGSAEMLTGAFGDSVLDDTAAGWERPDHPDYPMMKGDLEAVQAFIKSRGGPPGTSFPEARPDIATTDTGYAARAKAYESAIIDRLDDAGFWDADRGEVSQDLLSYDERRAIGEWHETSSDARPLSAYEFGQAPSNFRPGWDTEPALELAGDIPGLDATGKRIAEAVLTSKLLAMKDAPAELRAEALERALAGTVLKRRPDPGRWLVVPEMSEHDMVWPDNPDRPRSRDLMEGLSSSAWRPGFKLDLMEPEGSPVGKAQREDLDRYAEAHITATLDPAYSSLNKVWKTAPERALAASNLADLKALGPNASAGTMTGAGAIFDFIDFGAQYFRSPTRAIYSAGLAEAETLAMMKLSKDDRRVFLENIPLDDPRLTPFINIHRWSNEIDEALVEMERLRAFQVPGMGGVMKFEDQDLHDEYNEQAERRQFALDKIGISSWGGLTTFNNDVGSASGQLLIANNLPTIVGDVSADPYAFSGAVTPLNFAVYADQSGRLFGGAKVGDKELHGRIGYADPTEVELRVRARGGLVSGIYRLLGGDDISIEDVESGAARRGLQEDSNQESWLKNLGFYYFYRNALVTEAVGGLGFVGVEGPVLSEGGNFAPLVEQYGADKARAWSAAKISDRKTKPTQSVDRFQTTATSGAESPRDMFLLFAEAAESGSALPALDAGDPLVGVEMWKASELGSALGRQILAFKGRDPVEAAKADGFWGNAPENVRKRFESDHASALAAGDLHTGLAVREGLTMIGPDVGVGVAEVAIPGLRRLANVNTPGGRMTLAGDRAAAKAVGDLRQQASRHVDSMMKAEMDAAEAAIRADAEKLGVAGVEREKVRLGRGPTDDPVQPREVQAAWNDVLEAQRGLDGITASNRRRGLQIADLSPEARSLIDKLKAAVTDAEKVFNEVTVRVAGNPVESAVAVEKARIRRRWEVRRAEEMENATLTGWNAVSKIGDEAASNGRIVDEIDLGGVVQRMGDDSLAWHVEPSTAAGPSLAAGSARGAGTPRVGLGPSYTWRRPRPLFDDAKSPSAIAGAGKAGGLTRRELIESVLTDGLISDPGHPGLFYPRSPLAETLGWMAKSAKHDDNFVGATLRTAGGVVQLVANTDLLSWAPGKMSLTLAGVAEGGRKVVGKGRSWAVFNPVTGKTEVVKPSTVLGANEMAWFRWSKNRIAGQAARGKYDVDDFVLRLMDGVESKTDRKLAAKWLEALGDPDPMADQAAKVMRLLDEKLREAAAVRPARAGAEAKTDLSRRVAALKGIGKKWSAEARAKNFKAALASAREYAAAIGVDIDDYFKVLGVDAARAIDDLPRVVGDELVRTTGKTFDEAVEILRSRDRGSKKWVTKLKKKSPDLYAMLRYWEAKSRAPMTDLPLSGTRAELREAWASARPIASEMKRLEKAALDAAGRYIDDVAILERVNEFLKRSYQPRSDLELKTDLIDQLQGATRGATPEQVAHKRKMVLGIRQASASPQEAETLEITLDSISRVWAAVHNKPPEAWWVKHFADVKVGAKDLPRRRLSYFLMQRDLLDEKTPGFLMFSNVPMGAEGFSPSAVQAVLTSRLQGSLRAAVEELYPDYPKLRVASQLNSAGYWKGEMENSLVLEVFGSPEDMRGLAGAAALRLNQESALLVRAVDDVEQWKGLVERGVGAFLYEIKLAPDVTFTQIDELIRNDFRLPADEAERVAWLQERWGDAKDGKVKIVDKINTPTEYHDPAGPLLGATVIPSPAGGAPVLNLIAHSEADISRIERGLEALVAGGVSFEHKNRRVYAEFIGHKDAASVIVDGSRGKKAAAKRARRYQKEGEAHGQRYEDERGRFLGGRGAPQQKISGDDRRYGGKPGAPDPDGLSSASTEGKAGAYSTNLGGLGLRDGVAFTLDDITDLARGVERPEVDRALYRALGADVGKGTSNVKIYPLKNRFGATRKEVEATLDAWLNKIGWSYKIFGPDEFGNGFAPPRFREFNYDNKHVWIFQPHGANTFQDDAYTLAWRVTHEIAHGLMEPGNIEKFGGKGRRAGALGIQTKLPSTDIDAPILSLPDALKALEWEDATFYKQRELLEQDFGIKITDEEFAMEYQLNMADAVRRVLTGDFSSPDELGILARPVPPKDVLGAAQRIVAEAAAEMGLPASETFAQARALGHTPTSEPITSILPLPATTEEVMEVLRSSQLVTNAHVLKMLGDQPTYLDAVIKHLDEIRTSFKADGVTTRQVALAYAVTVASQGAGAIDLVKFQAKTGLDLKSGQLASYGVAVRADGTASVDLAKFKEKTGLDPGAASAAYGVTAGAVMDLVKFKRATGLNPGSEFTVRGVKGQLQIRPEGAAAAWFYSPEGRQAIDALERGVVDEEAWRGLAGVRAAFGDDRLERMGFFSEPGKGTFTLHNLDEFADEINAVRNRGIDAIAKVVSKAKGVGEGKTPFLQQLLTGSGRATIDARELNFWIGGGHPLSRKELTRVKVRTARLAKAKFSNKEVREYISGRIRRRIRALKKQGIGQDFDPEAFEVIVHHWLWDKLGGAETSHSGIYTARMSEHLAQVGPDDLIKGAAEHHRDGRWTIHLLENSDFSTVAHEFMHPVFHYLPEGQQARLVKWADKEAARLNKLRDNKQLPSGLEHFWYDKKDTAQLVGSEGGKLTNDGHELVARAWERYLADGQAPIRSLRDTFDQISRFMLAIYKNVTGSAIDVRVSADVRRVFDELVDFEKAEADQAMRRGKLADTVPPALGKLSPEDLLNKSMASALDQLSGSAQLARELLSEMTGFGSVQEREAWTILTREIDDALVGMPGEATAANVAESYQFGALPLNLTVAESKQASRATRRFLEKGGKLLKEDWDSMSPNIRDAVEQARAFFDHFFLRLQAVGRLKGWSREEFFERMLVEGYYSHFFTKKGKRKLDALIDGRAGRKYGGGLSSEFRAELHREIPSFAEDINKQYVRRIAEGLFEAEAKAAGDGYKWAATAELRETRVRAIIREEGLDRIEFFETDFVKVVQSYGKEGEQALANQRWFNHLSLAYKEGDKFAAVAAKDGFVVADRIAAQAGYRAVDQLTYHRLLRGAEISPIWKELSSEIEAIVRSADPADVRTSLFRLFKDHGADLTEVLVKETDVLVSKRLYVPFAIADMVEGFALPDAFKAMRDHNNPFVKSLGVLGMGWDDMLNVWKGSVTTLYTAFHGRNWASNTVANVLVHGIDGAHPLNQAFAVQMLNASDEAILALPLKDGGVISKTAKEWRTLASDTLADSRVVALADIEQTAAQARLKAPPVLAYGGISAVAAGAYGALTEEDPEKRWRAFAKYGYMGFYAGAAGKAGWDLFGSNAWNTLYKGGFSSKAWADSFDQILDDAAESLRRSGSVGIGGAVLSHFLLPDFLGVTPLAAGATMSSLSMALEGLVAIGGGAGVAIERQARFTNWIAGMRKGLSPESAADLVNRTLFNYDDLTYIEKNVLKRLFPFWTWTSKNALSLQPWLLANRPRRYAVWNKFLMTVHKNALQDVDVAMIPEEHRYRFIVATGAGKYIAGWGLHQESIAELTKTGPFLSETSAPTGLIAAMHPALPFAIKMLGGVDPYYMEDTKNIRTSRDVEFLHKDIQRFVGYRRMKNPRSGKVFPQTGHFPDGEGGYFEDAKLGAFRMALLRSLPVWRLTNEYNVIARDTFLSGAVLQAADVPEATATERVARFTLGIKSYAYDVEDMQEQIWRKYERRLMDLAADRGIAREALYYPKIPLVYEDTGMRPLPQPTSEEEVSP